MAILKKWQKGNWCPNYLVSEAPIMETPRDKRLAGWAHVDGDFFITCCCCGAIMHIEEDHLQSADDDLLITNPCATCQKCRIHSYYLLKGAPTRGFDSVSITSRDCKKCRKETDQIDFSEDGWCLCLNCLSTSPTI